MSTNKAYWYVLVFTGHGPVYVTKRDNGTKTAWWEAEKKPKSFAQSLAQDLALGLSLNGTNAVAVRSLWALDSQPYHYQNGGFEWKEATEDK